MYTSYMPTGECTDLSACRALVSSAKNFKTSLSRRVINFYEEKKAVYTELQRRDVLLACFFFIPLFFNYIFFFEQLKLINYLEFATFGGCNFIWAHFITANSAAKGFRNGVKFRVKFLPLIESLFMTYNLKNCKTGFIPNLALPT